jgi:hypothetical protein
MKPRHLAVCGCALALAFGVNAWAAEPTNMASAKPDSGMREQLKTMSPAEREAKLKELREQYSRPRPEREEVEKRREELKDLSPAERQAKLKEYRTPNTTNTSKVFSPEDRASKRKELRLRLQTRMEDIKTNADVKLTEQERQRFLERMQEVAKSFDNTTNTAAPDLKK